MEDLGIDVDLDIQGQEVILAASQHDLPTLRRLLRSTDSDVRDLLDASDADSGQTALHAAILGCIPYSDEEELQVNDTSDARDPRTDVQGVVNGVHNVLENGVQNGGMLHSEAAPPAAAEDAEMVRLAKDVVKYLLENGAVWNRVDKNNETPGCIALRLGFNELYEMLVDAGVRSEMLFNRLDDYEMLSEQEDAAEGEQGAETENPIVSTDEHLSTEHEGPPTNPNVTSAEFLRSPLVLQNDRLLDEDKNAVMMSWESDIMSMSADLLASRPGVRILNIGHGMGIIDTFFQAKSPSSHHIIEAHPAVLTEMRSKGWYEKQGVTVHEGKWQTVVQALIDEGITFDAIYFDTFAESYSSFRYFFTESVIGLLDPHGKWGFFNGLGADRQICYDIYGKVVEMDLFEAGFDAEWRDVDVPDLVKDGTWEDVKRSYFALDKYRLPVCSFMD
jgi:protein arginine N-methyltransferase 2